MNRYIHGFQKRLPLPLSYSLRYGFNCKFQFKSPSVYHKLTAFFQTAQELPKVTIYTDGACSGNPGPGGWGAVLLHGDVSKEIFGHEVNTTNNRMEMKAAINALNALRRRCHVVIYTDSKYLQLGITDWIKKWMKNNWVNSKKQPVKNIELWQEISRMLDRHRVDWNWVKAHNNDKYNERADRLAVQGRDIAAKELKKKR